MALRGARDLIVVNLGLDRTHLADRAGLPRPYLSLLDQLEEDRGWSRSVSERAQRLGYSPRTLTRACQQAVGRSAKQVVDDRVLLEARRLLVNRELTIEQIARELSFSEASNFARFFQRLTGENPDGWRTRMVTVSNCVIDSP